ncbi:MHS family MFS transporter [Streptomyces olivaceus]|uniref:MFS transporter n=1 Tax=Streptomyces olivaceus TaxID=47716 RepID=UPI000878979C|nr:MFS transporter [Streptomyces olivaceus]AOW90272.1 MFS transporter [Streptomyces olivaceus]MBZ6191915.1 MHS family MFS transporter [Streptomyces olivaceus]MBZ6199179.1 MHS family MFS transporter [Streptomyces olivaceus]MBZ6210751.1 MHS family MFS transporter [Streptomyces olivaceus]MBZ6304359.1 MHS family MFS transporter [Streptomyces olivaceus]
MPQPAATPASRETSLRKVVTASALGTTVEYYDFTLYATTAALVFDKIFFPDASPLVGTLAAFATYFVGYAARPLGGILFGHFGDRLGRKNVLIITMLMMGIGTFAIGLLPSYDSIGIAAPILLVLIRLIQGLGMGGEYGGGVLMALEYSPRSRQGFFTSLVHIGTPAGVLIPVGLVTVLDSTLPSGSYDSWAWRLPFLASILLVGVGIWMRLHVTESPEFVRMREDREVQSLPVKQVLTRRPATVVFSVLAKIAESGLFNIYYVVAITYVTTELDLAKGPVLLAVLIACAVECFTLPYFGALSDRIGRRKVYIFGAAFQAVLALPFFLLIETGQFWGYAVGMTLGLGVGHAAMYGAQGALFANLYPVNVRYTGLSVTQQIGATLGGGLSPLIGTALLSAAGGHWSWLIAYCVGVAVLSGLATTRLQAGEAPKPALPATDHTPHRAERTQVS